MNKRILITVFGLLLLAAPVHAQVVAQGAAGTSPWRVTFNGTAQPVTVSSGTVTFANTTLAVTNAGTFAVQATLAAETTKVIGTVNIAAAQSLAITGSVAVTGTFWQATQPVSIAGTVAVSGPLTDTQLRAAAVPVDGSGVTQPISGTVTANAGTGTLAVSGPVTDVQLRATPVPVSGTVTVTDGAGALNVIVDSSALPSLAATSTKQSDGSQKTQVVDGAGNVIGATSNALDINIKSGNPTTITATQATGSNLHTVVDSGTITTVTAVTAITNALPAGAALLGKVGIDQTTPGTTNRVDIGVFPDNEPFNIAQMNGVAVTMGNGGSGTGVQRMTLASDSTGNIATIGTSVTPGTAAGNLGKAEDAAHVTGDVGVLELNVRQDAPVQFTNADGDNSPRAVDAYGVAYMRIDHPNRIECTADNIAASLTQLTGCGVPGAGLSIYVTNIIAVSTTTTAGTFQLRTGTGSNCGTGTVAWLPPVSTSRTYGLPASNAAGGPLNVALFTPRKIAANTALCVIGVATNTTNITVTGFIAP